MDRIGDDFFLQSTFGGWWMVASENLIVCNNFIAQHKEFMQCAIKTRKLKLGSTQNAIYTIPFYYTL